MPELRQNILTKEWVIIATERAKRPKELARQVTPKPVAHHVAACPFCTGNEDKTPPEILRVPAENSAWQVRVIPNKFAALGAGRRAFAHYSPVAAQHWWLWRA